MSDDFDLFGFLEGRTFPEDSVKVYTDEKVAYSARDLINEYKELSEVKNPTTAQKSRLKEIEKEREEIRAKAEETAVRFHLRGVPNHVIKELTDDDTKGIDFLRLIGAVVVATESPDGKRTDVSYSRADVERLRDLLPAPSFSRLHASVLELVVASAAFEEGADAGFFPNS